MFVTSIRKIVSLTLKLAHYPACGTDREKLPAGFTYTWYLAVQCHITENEAAYTEVA